MKKNAFFTLVLMLLAAFGQAQNLVTISGLVTHVLNGAPVANHLVYCVAGDSLNPIYVDALSAADGSYSMSVDLPPGTPVVFVSTLTNCDPNGGLLVVESLIINGAAQADFQVCDDSLPPSPDCFADFYVEPVSNLSFQFTSFYFSFLDSSQVVSYLWDFGDGSTSTDANPIHTYAQGGLYTVTLTMEGQGGCVATAQYPFDTDFNGFPDCMGYIMYTQTDTTSFDFSAEIYDANGNLVTASSYNWDFGDGNTSTDPAPSHTYAVEGVYTVQLHAVTDQGCEIHSCDVVLAYICPIDTFWYGCQAMFYVGYTGDSLNPAGPPIDPLTLSFYDASLGGVLTWAWNFGDGDTSSLQNPIHTYADSGIYTVTLAITTIDGCESEVSFEICVGNNCLGDPEFDCQALFIPLPDSIGGNGLQFIDLSFVPDPSIEHWLWNFGDGSTSTEQNPYHVYAQPGIYTVTLTIESFMCNSSISFDIDTENPWNFSTQGNPGALGQANSSVATKEAFLFEGVKLFPNPAQTDLSVAFNSKKETAYALRISDITGKTLMTTQQDANVGLNTVHANVSALVPGLYLAEIRSGEAVQTIKFVKQ